MMAGVLKCVPGEKTKACTFALVFTALQSFQGIF